MYTVGEEAWAAALCALFEDEYVFVAVGPRGGGAWEEDALAVMGREVADPRGWAGQDWDEDSTERTSSRPGFPFTPGSAEEIARKLRDIDAGTAVRLLVALADDWCRITKVPGFSGNPEGLLTQARDALSRFGPHFSCYTNVAEARVPKSPRRMVDESGPGWTPLTEYTADYGLVVVSGSEVGVFWSFNPI
ncbi:hypothetical protein ACFV98_41370 [Streptomyces violascens]|uniref:hypothetical protein n=1 Tax=Streptomyces violascens TaxID=67381 RepID=UPI00364A6C0C